MFRRLITFNEARALIDAYAKSEPVGVEELSLIDAYERILAEDVPASLDIPPFDRSTVDGYALRAEDTYGAEENRGVKLKIVGAVAVGELPRAVISKGEAAEIVTGAPIPAGADAVVMLEDTEASEHELTVYSAVAKNENIMKKGTDIRKGEVILKARSVLGPREVGMLAAVGRATAKVYLKPEVGILSTGAEVTAPGKPLPPGRIYDINAYSLSAAVKQCGGKPVYYGVVPDDEAELQKTIEQSLKNTDVTLTSGGVSVGPKDAVPRAIQKIGKSSIIFSGVAVKPGKPLTFSVVDGKPVFSFPGHPASALLMFHLLARPLIQQLAGRTAMENHKVQAFAGARMFSAKGRRTFVTVKLRQVEEKRLVAEPVETGASGAITTLSKADGYVEIPENQQFIDVDEKVTVVLFAMNCWKRYELQYLRFSKA
jgi:putative molybdopterin biosynthesis protein